MGMLFSEFKIGSLKLKNRIVFAPMGTCLPDEQGRVNDRTVEYYARRAAGGAGLIIVEFSAVDKNNYSASWQLKINDDDKLPGLTRLAKAIQENGAKACIQVHHPGRQSSKRVTGNQTVAPSPIPDLLIGETPRELDVPEIHELEDRFAEAVLRARKAGFDCVEFHGAHGYFICQWLSPLSNKRDDEYGGDLFRRTRFAREILRKSRELVGPDYPLIFRISADEFADGGLTIDQTKEIAAILQEHGADAIHVSAGQFGAMQFTVQPMLKPRGFLVPLATEIKRAVKVPVIAVGRINDPRYAESILKEGNADLIGMGRPLLADPDLPKKAREERISEIVRCIACNACMYKLFYRESPISCSLNPEAGNETLVESRAQKPLKVMVIGSSADALEAARVAGVRGHKVEIYDQVEKIGGRWAWLQRGIIPHKLKALKELSIDVNLCSKTDSALVGRVKPDFIVAAPLMKPAEPGIPGLEEAGALSPEEVLERETPPGKVVIMGGDHAACEAAEHMIHRGAQVTILNDRSRAGNGLEPITRNALIEKMAREGIEMINKVEVISVVDDTTKYRNKQGKEEEIYADAVVCAAGYVSTGEREALLEECGIPYTLLEPCIEPRLILEAMETAAEAARKI